MVTMTHIAPFLFEDLSGEMPVPETREELAIIAPEPSPEEMAATALAERRESARQDGFAQGHTEGLAEGTEAGRAEGFREGREAGWREGMAAAQAEVDLLGNAAAAWQNADLQISDFLERSVLQLALEIARHVIRREVRAVTQKTLRTSLSQLAHDLGIAQTSVVWVLHPEQADLLKAHLGEIPQHWIIHSDDSMALGGVRVRAQWPDTMEEGSTVTQEWDARIETRWADMVARILEGN